MNKDLENFLPRDTLSTDLLQQSLPVEQSDHKL